MAQAQQRRSSMVVETSKKLGERHFREIIQGAYAITVDGYATLTVNGIEVSFGGGDTPEDIIESYQRAGGKLV